MGVRRGTAARLLRIERSTRRQRVKAVRMSMSPQGLERYQRLKTSGRHETIFIEPAYRYLIQQKTEDTERIVIKIAHRMRHICGMSEIADHTPEECHTFEWS